MDGIVERQSITHGVQNGAERFVGISFFEVRCGRYTADPFMVFCVLDSITSKPCSLIVSLPLWPVRKSPG